MITLAIVAGVVIITALFLLSTYTVVEPNKAHVVVFMGYGRKVYSPHKVASEKDKPTSYFFIPFLMKRTILPLTNIKMEIDQFELMDSNVAPFMCEVTCWFRIERPEVAVEKLDVEDGFESSVKGTLEELIRGIARASAMKQEILEIMRDRKTFGLTVESEVNGALEEWGLELVKLEIIDFSDPDGSNVIEDYENMRKAEINSNSRKIVAQQNKDAELVEAESQQLSGVRKAEAEREVEKALIEKEKQVKISAEEANVQVSMARERANVQEVEAEKALNVGRAQVEKQALIVEAEGQAEATYKKGKAQADVVQATGNAEAAIIKQKGLSEAEAKDAMAEALKKFNDAGITLEQIRAFVEIEKSKFENMGKALSSADLNIVSGAEGGNLFGFDINSKSGAGLGQFMKTLEAMTGKSGTEMVKEVTDTIKKK